MKLSKNIGLIVLLKSLICFFMMSAILLLLSYYGGAFERSAEAVDTSLFSDNAKKELVTVILDAGHGGIDDGAKSVTGTKEKDLNLEVAKLVENYLKLYNINVVMTRENDEMLTLPGAGSRKKQDVSARVNIANQYEKPYFVSIHMNKYPIEKYSGLQVFYSGNNDESLEFANYITNTVKNELQQNTIRPPKNAGSSIFVLDRLYTPAVLIECGFLSNWQEAKLLDTPEYRDTLALTIASAIIEYLKI